MEPRKLNIMIDYDDTYTEDMILWQDVLRIMLHRGHKVFLVTLRSMDRPIEYPEFFVENKIPIVYCEWRAKDIVCREQGFLIDIWIDNDPQYITQGFVL